MKMLRYLLPLLAFLGLAGFLAKGLGLHPREVPSPLIDKPAPAFALQRADDPTAVIRRDDLLGKVWVLNVWASWCVSCREEHAALLEFSRSGVVPVYGLDYKDQRDAAVRWLAELGNPYAASLFDGDGRVGIDFGVYGVPETFVIDKQGVIRLKIAGPLTPDTIRQRIVPLVKQLDA